MWVALQIGVCLIFLLLAAFWAGKKIGQRRFFKLEEDMKALELSFKHLVEDIEMVSSHNIKALDGQCNVLKELLNIADKKCLFAGDLLKEIDEGIDSLRKRNLNPANALTSIDQGHDKRFRKEVQDTLEEMLKKIVALNARLGELEANESSIDHEEIRAIVDAEMARYLQVLDANFEELPEPANEKIPEMTNGRLNDRSIEKPVPLRAISREIPLQSASVPTSASTVARAPVQFKEMRPATVDESVRLPVTAKKADMHNSASNKGIPANFTIQEVLRLYSEGVTLPQIARTLNMGKGEIELIIKMYGEGITMRNVI
ncbi:MAG: hypothetical protein PHD82_04220 [Candidatus Riflebacteria bacterium]|nr:hypothetical protein [Candidatus Riflebacteria bacterium]